MIAIRATNSSGFYSAAGNRERSKQHPACHVDEPAEHPDPARIQVEDRVIAEGAIPAGVLIMIAIRKAIHATSGQARE